MKNLIAFLFLVVITISPVEAKLFEALIVLKNGDTINGNIDVRTNLFDSKLVDPLSFKKKLKVVDKSGKKVKYTPEEVEYFVLYGAAEGSMRFESRFIKSENCFVQLVHDGPLKVYKYYFPHGYDGSAQHHFLLKSDQVHFLRLLPRQWRKQLVEYFPDNEMFKAEKEAKAVKYFDFLDWIKTSETANF